MIFHLPLIYILFINKKNMWNLKSILCYLLNSFPSIKLHILNSLNSSSNLKKINYVKPFVNKCITTIIISEHKIILKRFPYSLVGCNMDPQTSCHIYNIIPPSSWGLSNWTSSGSWFRAVPLNVFWFMVSILCVTLL